MCLRVRLLRVGVLSIAAIALVACAGRQPKAAVAPEPAAKPAGQQGYRFYMTQNGKRMTADDFDAWLKANGLRVQGGRVVGNVGDAKAAKVASDGGTRPAGTRGKQVVAPKANTGVRASGTSKAALTGKSKAKATKASGVTVAVARKDD